MNILFICTSNKDRSPALQKYFEANYEQHSYRSAGVNQYFTKLHGKHYLTADDIDWAELIVYAEDIHYKLADRDFKQTKIGIKDCLTLNLGQYDEGQKGEDYLIKAENILYRHL